MKIALIILLGLVVLVIAFIFVARRGLARMQHYQFAHDLLPSELFANPASVILPLIAPDSATPGGRDMLLALWEEAGRRSGDGIVVPPDGLDYTTDVFGHPNATACLIQLPPPLKKPEAYFAAIIFDGPGLAVGAPRQLRYLVLEHHGDNNGTPRTLVGEWSAKDNGKLTYSEHGTGIAPDMTSFAARVREIVEKTPVV
jgi:hypothetical protein